ncbi:MULTISPECIES: hypothetical protein [Clostridium]|uniref:hypothetical protein n=1 Tax=Clostridium TaxID=1485 RepID=UPI0008246B98|nr:MULTISPECIES: hypothetical protein [Clostridium]PJI07941.1 hypothetical protein CUB90_08695 [Clostridium sp. CT7]
MNEIFLKWDELSGRMTDMKNIKGQNSNFKLESPEDSWQKKSLSVEMNMKSNFEDVDKEVLKIRRDTFKRDIPELSSKKLEKFFNEPKIQVMVTLVGGGFLITSKVLQKILKNNFYRYEVKDESSKLKRCELEVTRKGINMKKISDLSRSGKEYYFYNVLGNKPNLYNSHKNQEKFIADNYVYMANSLKGVDSVEIKKNINFSEKYIKLLGKEFEGRDIKDIAELMAKNNSSYGKRRNSPKDTFE